MTTFVLVHGAHLGSWSWNLVISSLNRRGHQAINIDLPIDQPGLGAADYANAIGKQIELSPFKEDLVVVGHALAGLSIPLLANKYSIRKFIYIAPLVPSPGQSMTVQLNGSQKDMMLVEKFPNPITNRADTFKYWLHDCEPDIAYWAASRFRPQHFEPIMTEASPLKKLPDISTSAIVCTNDRLINGQWAENASRNILKTEPILIDSGHCPQLSRPQELALLLMQLGNARSK